MNVSYMVVCRVCTSLFFLQVAVPNLNVRPHHLRSKMPEQPKGFFQTITCDMCFTGDAHGEVVKIACGSTEEKEVQKERSEMQEMGADPEGDVSKQAFTTKTVRSGEVISGDGAHRAVFNCESYSCEPYSIYLPVGLDLSSNPQIWPYPDSKL